MAIDPDNQTTKTNRVWFDTEFIENGRTIDLISIGLVRENGAELYLENSDCDRTLASSWVQENVFPHLRGGECLLPKQQIAERVREFVGSSPEFWAYYADYDWVAMCQLYGTMMELPAGWPMSCLDIKQEAHRLGNPKLPSVGKGEHDALADARWNRTAWEFINAQ